MRIDGPGVLLGFDNFSSRPLPDKRLASSRVILDVPDDAIGIALGAPSAR
jgi:hypothetical protein